MQTKQGAKTSKIRPRTNWQENLEAQTHPQNEGVDVERSRQLRHRTSHLTSNTFGRTVLGKSRLRIIRCLQCRYLAMNNITIRSVPTRTLTPRLTRFCTPCTPGLFPNGGLNSPNRSTSASMVTAQNES